MRSVPPVLLALDLGTATSAASLVGRVDGRHRLLATTAIPAGDPLEPALDDLVAAVRAADPALADALDLPPGAGTEADPTIPRLVARSAPAPRLAVLAGSGRGLDRMLAAARSAGWRADGVVPHGATDELAAVRLLLDPALAAILVGAAEPPAADERRALGELIRLVGAIAARRPEVAILLAGGAAREGGRFAAPAALPAVALDGSTDALRLALVDRRPLPLDSRAAAARATASLAEVLDRRIETLEVGFDGGLRVVAAPTGDGIGRSEAALVPAAALVPPEPDDEVVDAIGRWSTEARERNRLRDRLLDLRLSPWGDVAGDGARLRLAAARAALERLLAATPDLDGEPPDLVVAAGGAWAVAPGPAVMLALVDVARRAGVSQYAVDAARLLGPVGMIEDEGERRALLADLADDVLVPLGSAIVPGGMHRSRHPGRLAVAVAGSRVELELAAGGLQVVDLPPGELARASLRFRDGVHLGGRGRAFEVEVTGGLGGLLVDLRDVPLVLPERSERRRALLASWEGALWVGAE